MRLIGKVDTEKDANIVSQAFAREGITFELEPQKNNDWGSADYGTLMYRIWIIDEEQVDRATNIFDTFLQNPQDPLFSKTENPIRNVRIPTKERPASNSSKIIDISKAAREEEPLGRLTYYIILLCSLLFITDVLTKPENWPIPSSLPLAHLYASPVLQQLTYDYPQPYELFNKFVDKYGQEKVLNPQELPLDAENLLARIINIPYWQGIYESVFNYFKTGNFQVQDVPMFEKIKQGEVWRLFTPALLHSDIFHILFNMLWLYALGRQMEDKLGNLRYLIFIFATGILVNTAQYLVSGSNFLGFSGVLCAMIAFVATRQYLAPWEGYRMDRATKIFIYIFIFGMAAFQLVSFITEISTGVSFSPGIANTAHLSGLALGAILGHMTYFSRT